jgi:hypothetical protein
LDKTRRAAMQRRASQGSGWREVAGGLRQRRTGGRRWRACAAWHVERVTAQATRSRPGRACAPWRGEQLGDGMARRPWRSAPVRKCVSKGGRRARLSSEASGFCSAWSRVCQDWRGASCCHCLCCFALLLLPLVALRVYQLAREQVVGTGDACTTGVVRALVCGGWMDEWILVGTREGKKISS